MKNFMSWLIFIAMIAIALFASASEWLPMITSATSSLSNASDAMTDMTGFNWKAAGGVLFFGTMLLIYLNTKPKAAEENEALPGIDYSVPRFIDVRIIE